MSSARRRHHADDDRLSPRGPNNYRNRRDPNEPLILGDELGQIVGSATGEADHDVLPGGWEGTDDATSTSPSDIVNPNPRDNWDDADNEEFQDAVVGRAAGGGMGRNEGGVSDIKGTPVEDSRNWEEDPIEAEP